MAIDRIEARKLNVPSSDVLQPIRYYKEQAVGTCSALLNPIPYLRYVATARTGEQLRLQCNVVSQYLQDRKIALLPSAQANRDALDHWARSSRKTRFTL